MRNSTVDLKDVGMQNEKLVLALLRKNGPMSQTQLRKLSGLSTSTSSYIINRLRVKGWINEEKGTSKSRGAKPVILSIRNNGAYAIGVDISPFAVRLGLYDFNANTVAMKKEPFKSKDPEFVADIIASLITEIIKENKIKTKTLLGVGIAISGTVQNNAIVKIGSPLGWKDVNLKEIMGKRLSYNFQIYPTVVRMLAEFKLQDDYANVLYVNASSGVGCHSVIEGHLFGMKTGRCCEMGHFTIVPNGKLCGCGKRGCLETIVGSVAMSEQIKSDIAKGKKTILSKTITTQDSPEEVMLKWAEAINAADEYAASLADFVAEQMLVPISNTINITQPEQVILAGGVCLAAYESIKAKLEENGEELIYNYSPKSIKITRARAGSDALILGAAMRIII